jgi:hypothetical protein
MKKMNCCDPGPWSLNCGGKLILEILSMRWDHRVRSLGAEEVIYYTFPVFVQPRVWPFWNVYSSVYWHSCRAQCYKTYGRKLQLFIKASVFFSGKLFQPSLMFVGKAKSPTLEWSIWKVLHSCRLQLTRKHLTRLERLARDKHSCLL